MNPSKGGSSQSQFAMTSKYNKIKNFIQVHVSVHEMLHLLIQIGDSIIVGWIYTKKYGHDAVCWQIQPTQFDPSLFWLHHTTSYGNQICPKLGTSKCWLLMAKSNGVACRWSVIMALLSARKRSSRPERRKVVNFRAATAPVGSSG